MFQYCRTLTNVVLPNTIESLDSSSFNGCHLLEEINLPNSIKFINEYVFTDCPALSNIKLPESLIDLGYGVFQNSDIHSIVIPSGITEIKDSVFWDCDNLSSIVLPNTITRIGNGAFEYCYSLQNIFYSGNKNEFYSIEVGSGNSYVYNSIIEFNSQVTELEYVENDKYSYVVDNLNNIYDFKYNDSQIICFDFSDFEGNTIKSLRRSAFNECSSLTHIVIPNTVALIGEYVFSNSIKKVFYLGSEEDFANIKVLNNNEYLYNSEIEYNSEVTDIEYVENEKYSYLVDNLDNIYEFKYKDNSITTFDFSEFDGQRLDAALNEKLTQKMFVELCKAKTELEDILKEDKKK
jgi:hypothetical protein